MRAIFAIVIIFVVSISAYLTYCNRIDGSTFTFLGNRGRG